MQDTMLKQLENLNSLITRVLPTVIKRLPDIGETIRRAEANETALAEGMLAALLSLTRETKESQPEVAPESAISVEVFHEFELDGEAYDAVNVKWTGETRLTIEEAIKAADTGNNHVIRSEAEWQQAHKHRQKLPEKLNGRWLITARPLPDGPRHVSCLSQVCGVWCGLWYCLVGQWCNDCLVLRRRA